MPSVTLQRPNDLRLVGLRLAVLVVLCIAVFRNELFMFSWAIEDPEAAHALVAPLLIALLVVCRRRALAEAVAPGSLWGLALVGLAIAVYFFSTWPFNYSYPRLLALVPAIAGCIVAVAGWKFLVRCLPMLLILVLAIPTGNRYYAFLIIKPETYTLGAVRSVLDLLPGVYVDLEGPDLSYYGAHGTGTIALGEHHRGAGLLLAYASLGAFVIFARVRPWWQLAGLAVLTPVIILLCNFLRVFAWGLITIYGSIGPLSPVPRMLSSTLSLLLVYGLFVLACVVIAKFVVTAEATGREMPHAGEPHA